MPDRDYTKLFLEAVGDEEDFHEVLDILKKSTGGNIWLIGGFVYRNIAKVLYGTPCPKIDLDFIVEKADKNFDFPQNWEKAENRYGNPKFVRLDGLEVDFVPLTNVNSIIRRNIEPIIQNYLTGTPLTIQSIAYDVLNDKIIGEIGLKSIESRTIAVNNPEQAEIYGEKKGRGIDEIMHQKAKELGFEVLI